MKRTQFDPSKPIAMVWRRSEQRRTPGGLRSGSINAGLSSPSSILPARLTPPGSHKARLPAVPEKHEKKEIHKTQTTLTVVQETPRQANRAMCHRRFRLPRALGSRASFASGRLCCGSEIDHCNLASLAIQQVRRFPAMFADVNTGLFCPKASGNRGPICWHRPL